MRRLALSVALALLASLALADAVVNVPKGDPEMAAAFAKARASLGGFLEKLRHPPAGTENFSVKVGFSDAANGSGYAIVNPGAGSDKVEYFWMVGIKETASGFTAAIGNGPEIVKSVREGQVVAFQRAQIADWMYFEGGKIKGNYTMCPLLSRMGEAEAQEMRVKFGTECR